MKPAIARARKGAFLSQRKRCFYCELPIWNTDRERNQLISRHGISEDAAKSLQCTAEHMQARQDDGTHDQWNIVAACLRCNRARHEGGAGATPLQHRQRVADAMANGMWHLPEIHAAFAGIAGTTVVGPPPASTPVE
jgi:5-methylcytosine-specific restriction endonuclease McrA